VRELHTVDFHLELVRMLEPQKGLHTPGAPFSIPAEVKAHVSDMLAKEGIAGSYAVVHPGTVREEKFWVDERWADVCAHLHEHAGLRVVLSGSGDGLEHAHLQHLRGLLRVPVTDLTGRLSLVEFAAVVDQCRIILGVDSMAMHLAAMLQKPQVALFGPTNPFHWRPRHARALVLLAGEDGHLIRFAPRERKGDMKLISTQAVIDATRRLLSSA
jgi:ADP-heptose:LPS heptosyltransferase